MVDFSYGTPLAMAIARRITSSSPSRSMSDQRSPQPSPRRHPVAASTHRYAPNSGSSSRAAESNSSTSSTVGGVTVFRVCGGGVASTAGDRAISPHLRACSSDWRTTV
ncbi:MAG: hypothetical protein U5K29_04075 [Acidimicrobiales bacterium]|nr:hypothetical protein [Acidimicrobiales bacterium]